MLPHTTGLEIVRDTGLPQHCPLLLSLDFQHQSDLKMVYRLPFAFHELKPLDYVDVVHNVERAVWQPVGQQFSDAIENNDVNRAYDIWSSSAEKFCIQIAIQQGLIVQRKHRGRGGVPRVVQVGCHAPPAKSEHGAASHRTASILKLRRRVAQLCCKLRSNLVPQSPAHNQMVQLQHNIAQSWQRLFADSQYPTLTDTVEHVRGILDCLDAEFETVQQSLAERRIATFQQHLIQDWTSTKKATYAWLRCKEPLTTPCFATGAVHEYAVRHSELHRMMIQAWRPLFNRYEARAPPDYAQFVARFPDCLPHDAPCNAQQPYQIPDIDEYILARVIRQLTPRVGGVDGWHVPEIKALGPHSSRQLARLFNLLAR